MSWNVTLIGTPEKISVALDEEHEKLTDMSKEEFGAALPGLKILVEQNMNTFEGQGIILRLEASGHGYRTEKGEQRTLCIKLDPCYGKILI